VTLSDSLSCLISYIQCTVFCCILLLNQVRLITCWLYSYCCVITISHTSYTTYSDIAIKESKLFVGMLPLRIDETKLTELFQPFGTISEIYVMRDLRGGSKVSVLFTNILYSSVII
jgi:RNA recognition motif. (a.k.a. RRM, RBD, or RNP domain)